MPQLTKCSATDCPHESTCFRQSAQDSENQEYLNFMYSCCDEGNGFSSYISKGVGR